jgi:hypothetical protein
MSSPFLPITTGHPTQLPGFMKGHKTNDNWVGVGRPGETYTFPETLSPGRLTQVHTMRQHIDIKSEGTQKCLIY